MAVHLRPLKVVLTNYPEGQIEEMEAVNNPEDPAAGSRKVPFSRVLYIERDDFMEVPARKFFRLSPTGTKSVCVTPTSSNASRSSRMPPAKIAELHCTIDPGFQERRRDRRAQNQGHHPLGLRRARD